MTKASSLVVYAAGFLLLLFGINAYNSPGSDISRFWEAIGICTGFLVLVGMVIARRRDGSTP
jgi:hypothetical protein